LKTSSCTLAAAKSETEIEIRNSIGRADAPQRVSLGDDCIMPGQLSGGDDQRVAVFRALINSRNSCWQTNRPAALDHAPPPRSASLLVE